MKKNTTILVLLYALFLIPAKTFAGSNFFSKVCTSKKEYLQAGDVIYFTLVLLNDDIEDPSYISILDSMLNFKFYGGDNNSDGVLNIGEIWYYTSHYTVTQNDIDTNGGGDGKISGDTTVKVYDNVGNWVYLGGNGYEVWIGESPEQQYPFYSFSLSSDVSSVQNAGDVITYNATVHNLADFPLEVDILSQFTFVSGDANNNTKLDYNEVWNYVATYTVTQTDIDNNGIDRFGNPDGDGDIDYEALIVISNYCDTVTEIQYTEVLIESSSIPNLTVCDDSVNDGYTQFDLSLQDNAIKNGATNAVVTYHLTQSDAINGINALPTIYTNVTNPQKIFSRLKNLDNGNVELNSFYFFVQEPIPAPTGNTKQYVCSHSSITLSDLAVFNTSGYDGIYWYTTSDASTPLDPNTIVTDGTTYYAFQGIGSCVASLAVTVWLVTDIPAPNAATDYYFCADRNYSFEDVAVSNNNGFEGVYWFTDPSQISVVNPNTSINDGETYWVSQGVGPCAASKQVNFHLNSTIPAPDGPTTYNCTSTCTLTDINVTPTINGANIYWFDVNDNTGTPLLLNTLLENGITYYAFQDLGSCVSSLAVTVNNDTTDTDGDGVTNVQETIDETDLNDFCDFLMSSQTLFPSQQWIGADCDGDGVSNGNEVADATNPQDGCDYIFSHQTLFWSNEWMAMDCDGDGVSNGQEVLDATNPLNMCSFSQFSITLNPSTEWYAADCDNDGLSNGEEDLFGTNPLDDDTDNDGILDGNEIYDSNTARRSLEFTATNPNNPDTDDDGILDGTEIGLTEPQGNNTNLNIFIPDADPATKTNPTISDSDNDNLLDGEEDVNHNGRVDYGETDPNNRDTDGDGLNDDVDPTPALGIKNEIISQLTLHPNPTNGWVYFELSNQLLEGYVYVYDIQSRLVKTEVLKQQNQNYSLNLSVLNSGVYTVKVMSENKIWLNKVIIK